MFDQSPLISTPVVRFPRQRPSRNAFPEVVQIGLDHYLLNLSSPFFNTSAVLNTHDTAHPTDARTKFGLLGTKFGFVENEECIPSD